MSIDSPASGIMEFIIASDNVKKSLDYLLLHRALVKASPMERVEITSLMLKLHTVLINFIATHNSELSSTVQDQST